MNATTIKAIETIYNGYRFRSRLEARWAVFFDALGVKYEYEREGFDLTKLLDVSQFSTDGGESPSLIDKAEDWVRDLDGDPALYLPDFWLPVQDCWVEIKGVDPTKKETALAEMLSVCTAKDVFVFAGDIYAPPANFENGTTAQVFFADGWGWDESYCWCECPLCGLLGIEFDGRADRLDCKASRCAGDGHRRDRGYNASSPRLMAAYTTARQARFEHGETPKRRRR